MLLPLPECIQKEIFEWDSTYYILFRSCLEEIEIRVAQQLSVLYPLTLQKKVQYDLGYFQFKYRYKSNDHIVFIHEGTTSFHDTQYILQDWNMTKGTRRTRFLYL
uniref:Uncharacterized protein n=1 Tax=viral metagenome TaxID=1070528 RepID=A0A6C0D1H6_9ZZZZ